ncbi:hypothetical protein PUNSTDRAFT_48709 [Punctularia strigosozonata HHB-11173 SS5]|uniref:uncharacterized protein n=1 Tax=Punctularia strigosozonata (strain HHB-11173) TaxID=741275 RepID=UPI000441796B|nr:uncharacterized protein PUNSTDRAFT_48709 [Punctularia strigosozonata HHB-11173 SS5]EIN13785.1 hypothetical protein PUNSTDRAFT_48709 [Punctularia strigosozonata HHB-11173 SS5]
MTSNQAQQTTTPYRLTSLPDKHAVAAEYAGKPLTALRTPALVIDRAVFAANCASMHRKAQEWATSFRAHVKSHKTVEGTRLQLRTAVDSTSAVVVSTLMEAWKILESGLVADGTVTDILYGLPVAPNKIADLDAIRGTLASNGAVVRLLIDHTDQIEHLERFESARSSPGSWSVFVKVDAGGKRAGVIPGSARFETVVQKALFSPAIQVYGFYCHAGNSYASTSLDEASSFLSSEVEAVNTAAGLALAILSGSPGAQPRTDPFVLSVGSTPTAHAASAETKAKLEAVLNGRLELHAGNYPLLDLQQVHTSLVDHPRIAQRVVTTVISYYPGRGEGGVDEALCDAGAIAMSKDTGPSGGYGEVIGLPWKLAKVSQEHGILRPTSSGAEPLQIGSVVQVVGQHACLTLAAYPWYYVVDSGIEGGNAVVDVWVPWKGW